MELSVERVEGQSPRGEMLFLHGILGRGANLRTLAKRFVAACPGWSAVLVDLRGHGQSKDVPPGEPETVARCADDVAELAARSEIGVRAILGHSFGGKVALELAGRGLSPGGRTCERYVIVDSLPGVRPTGRGSETTLEVLSILREIDRGPALASRQAFALALRERGIAEGIAQWLATGLRKDEDGFRFGTSLALVDAFLADYFARDLWAAVESPALGAEVHLVIGERSTVYDDEALARARRATEGGRVTIDVLPAGHWVHVEAPDPLLETLVRRVGPRNDA